MSYRELTMIDVKEVLRRWVAGQSARQIARETGTDRKTVARYVRSAEALGVPRTTTPSDEDVARVVGAVQSRVEPAPSDEQRTLERHRDLIAAWLQQEKPLKLSKVHVLLARDHGVVISYDTLRRFAARTLGWRKRRPTVRVDDTLPGEVAQIDFGCVGRLHDAQLGRVRKLWVLIVTLVYSRHQFVWPAFEQTTAVVCEALDTAWQFFGGVPKVLIVDNMKSVVVRADAVEPKLNDAFLEYAQRCGFFVDAARVRSPKDKPRVENQVAYVRESWFEGEQFESLDAARVSALAWCRDIAGLRVHGTTREQPLVVYDREERSHMLPAPSGSFDVPRWADAKVHLDHHIQVQRALYSVPTRFIGKQVRVRADSRTVRIFFGGELIKLHPRVAAGKRSTDTTDYPSGTDVYATRAIDRLHQRALEQGPLVGEYARRLLDVPLPWTRVRRVQELLKLCQRFGVGRVEAVCQSALSFDVIDVARIGRMLKAALPAVSPEQHSEHAKVIALNPPRFARDGAHFATRSARGGGDS
jgi:transposase